MKHKKFNYNSDFMSRKQDEQLEQLEEKLTALYANATNDIKAELTDFMAKYEKDYESKRLQVEAGTLSEDEFSAWNRTQILNQTRYSKAVETMTNTLVNTDVAAMAAVNEELPKAVAQSYDYITALGAKAAEGTGLTMETFQIYNAETVQALIRDNPDLMPEPKVDIPEDKRWNKDRINREITQGIVKGESIPKISDRLAKVTTMDKNAAVRNARTAMTSAENLGRSQAADDLKAQGIPTEEVWSATYDDRTRDTHLMLDGTTRDENGYFGVGIINTPLRYPADPAGDPEEVYNCRCRLNIQLKGIDHSQDDDLYEKFMKENFPNDWKNLEENEPYQARQAEKELAKERQQELRSQQQAQVKEPEIITKEQEPVATYKPEELPKASELEPTTGLTSGTREKVQGKDITDTWERRPDKYEFAIDDAIDAQGFNGLPQILPEEEFNKAAEESQIIMQRGYAASTQETADAYREALYYGDWYVDCSGGDAFGKGMYTTFNDGSTLENWTKDYATMYASAYNRPYGYVETMTLSPDAQIISHGEAQKLAEEIRDEWHDSDKLAEYTSQTVEERLSSANFSDIEKAYIKDRYFGIETDYSEDRDTVTWYRSLTPEEKEELDGRVSVEVVKIKEETRNTIDGYQTIDAGTAAALNGYDAVKAGEGHGELVVLNRTKLIIKGE